MFIRSTMCMKLSLPLAVPVGRQIDARESHVNASEVPEGGRPWSEVRRLGAGKHLLLLLLLLLLLDGSDKLDEGLGLDF